MLNLRLVASVEKYVGKKFVTTFHPKCLEVSEEKIERESLRYRNLIA